MAVPDVDGSPTLEFRRDPRRRRRALAFSSLGLVIIFIAAVLLFSLRYGEPWWSTLLRFGAVVLGVGAGVSWSVRRRPRLPLRLTSQDLQITGPDGSTLAVDWTNVARAEVRGGLNPRLIVEPIDPQSTRPPLRRRQWAGGRMVGRPYELTVPLDLMTPGLDVLRHEIARRLPGSTR